MWEISLVLNVDFLFIPRAKIEQCVAVLQLRNVFQKINAVRVWGQGQTRRRIASFADENPYANIDRFKNRKFFKIFFGPE